MRKKIPIRLTEDGVNKAIKEVKEYKKWLKKKAKELVKILCKEGEDYAINAVGHIDTGETVQSIQATRNGNKGVIVAGGNAIWLEFGTGVARNGVVGSSPHPIGDQIGYTIGTYGQGKGADPDGWWYFDPASNELKHTYGIEANMFLYRTAQELKRIAPERAKEVFKLD